MWKHLVPDFTVRCTPKIESNGLTTFSVVIQGCWCVLCACLNFFFWWQISLEGNILCGLINYLVLVNEQLNHTSLRPISISCSSTYPLRQRKNFNMIDDGFDESPFLTRNVTKAIGDRFIKNKIPLSLLIPHTPILQINTNPNSSIEFESKHFQY